MARPARNDMQTDITVKQLKQAITKYVGAQRTERSFHTFELTHGRWLEPTAPADMELVRYAEQTARSAIGSASARLVLSLLFQKDDDHLLRYREAARRSVRGGCNTIGICCRSALGQMDQGITVFDSSNRLSVWNRRFCSLLDLPESVGQVGIPLEDIVHYSSRTW